MSHPSSPNWYEIPLSQNSFSFLLLFPFYCNLHLSLQHTTTVESAPHDALTRNFFEMFQHSHSRCNQKEMREKSKRKSCEHAKTLNLEIASERGWRERKVILHSRDYSILSPPENPQKKASKCHLSPVRPVAKSTFQLQSKENMNFCYVVQSLSCSPSLDHSLASHYRSPAWLT